MTFDFVTVCCHCNVQPQSLKTSPVKLPDLPVKVMLLYSTAGLLAWLLFIHFFISCSDLCPCGLHRCVKIVTLWLDFYFGGSRKSCREPNLLNKGLRWVPEQVMLLPPQHATVELLTETGIHGVLMLNVVKSEALQKAAQKCTREWPWRGERPNLKKSRK